MKPTQTKYNKAFTVKVFHDYIHEWEEVGKDHKPKDDEVVAFNLRGKKATRVKNNYSKVSFVKFHDQAIQQIHNDRHQARLNGDLSTRPDLAIIAAHIQDGVLRELTDLSSVTRFECDEYPEIGDYLNITYGLNEKPKK